MDFSKGAKPLYYQLKNIIKDRIINNEYKIGEKIETEKELEQEFKLSRITVRQALNELVQEGYLLRQRGKGTIVLGNNMFEEHLVKVKSFTEEMEDRGLEPGTLSFKISSIKPNDFLIEKFKVKEGDEVYRIQRVRTANELPIVVFETYLPKQYGFTESELTKIESLYQYFKEKKISIANVSESFEVSYANKILSEKLNVDIEFPLFLRTRQSFDPDGNIIEYTKAYYNSKLYKFHLNMRGNR